MMSSIRTSLKDGSAVNSGIAATEQQLSRCPAPTPRIQLLIVET